jgi:acyl-[acyl-carrier-protein]-phospholipid O-acyltransferase/long-chain-fatty-acid--[acyl-carrier-protein] ligase
MRSLSFLGFLVTQALGAFNDNAFKLFLLSTGLVSIPLGGALFIAPFLLFSTYAGWAADRWSKRRLIVFFKAAEVALMALAFAALAAGSVPALLGLLFLMGAHSAFFAPVKLAVVPELVAEAELSDANGLVQLTTFAGIIAGTGVAGWLAFHPHRAPWAFLAAAGAGLLSSLSIVRLPPAGNAEPLRLNFIGEALESGRRLAGLPGVFLATVGSAYFWFAAALLQMTLLPLGTTAQLAAAVGIGAGSALAGRLSRSRVELGLVPAGALGLVLFGVLLYFKRSPWLVGLLGVSAGAFIVPLQAYIQLRAPAEERGRLLAFGNILSFIAILVASGFYWYFADFAKLHGPEIFLAQALMSAAVAAYICWMLPDFLVRLSLYPIANILYRIRSLGEANIPAEGPALLVSNHVSFIDAFLITMASPRLVRFMMFRAYYDLPLVGWFFKAMGCIPVSDRDGPKAIIESFRAARAALEKGEAVCIFAEGEISRHGQMLRFKKGFERIVEGLDIPVVPVHLDQVWGSIFSFSGGKTLFKRPRRIPYPVTVSFGAPLPSTVDAFTLRQAILELGAAAFRHRLERQPSLGRAFAAHAWRHPFRLAVADSLGQKLTYLELYLKARLMPVDMPEPRVGVLLPPSAGGVIANLGLALAGKVPVNLNYTASPEIIEACRAKAGLDHVITSRKFVEKLGWSVPGAVYLEDAKPSWGRLFRPLARPRLDQTATIMFTSGSTGIPKGVELSHANVLSNILAVAQVYDLGPTDRLMGILPFFHSFGFTASLWLPLLSGMGAVYHFSPLDAKKIGELVADYRCTFLMGTPTFLQSFIRRVDAQKFRTLRCVVVGAEKLREETAAAFEEKFGLRPMEGYGCTELSPVAAVNIPDIDWPHHKQKGTKSGTVGHPLPGVFMKVVDPNSGEPLSCDAAGLLLVKGPNVMRGYLNDAKKTEEALREGYYVTGDIAAIDADGFVTITDRLSRFSKIGGEMVPHIRVEEKLHEAAGASEQVFVVTAVPDEKRGERLVVLYTGDLDPKAVAAKVTGIPNLWIPDRFYKVEGFPVLGTGKLDLQAVKAKARELDGAA